MIPIMTPTECVTAIGRLAATRNVRPDRIHSVAVSTLDHIREHGDTTLACRLLDAMHKGERVKSLAFWYSHFSGALATFSVHKETGLYKCKLKEGWAASREKFDIEGAYATTYADLTAEKDPKTLTAAALEKWLTKAAENDQMFPGTSQPKVANEARTLASRLVAIIRTERKAGLQAIQEEAMAEAA